MEPLQQSGQPAHYSLRLIRKADNDQVARLLRKVMKEFDAAGEGSSFNDPEIDSMYESYLPPKAAFYVIARGNEILGCGGIGPLAGDNGDTCELRKMYFYPEIRGMGWGRKMIALCLEQAHRLGYKKCYLETTERMRQANILYQKMGFRKLDGPLGSTGHCHCESWYLKELGGES